MRTPYKESVASNIRISVSLHTDKSMYMFTYSLNQLMMTDVQSDKI